MLGSNCIKIKKHYNLSNRQNSVTHRRAKLKHQGPRNINLNSLRGYRFPVTAISSILHRITGVLMVALLPFLLWAFSVSMDCGESFYYIQALLMHSAWSILVWIFLSAISYHLIAGIRHLMMDFGFGEAMLMATASSILVLALAIMTAVFWGLWLWVI